MSAAPRRASRRRRPPETHALLSPPAIFGWLLASVFTLWIAVENWPDPESRVGAPEFFERVTGLAMDLGEPRWACARGTHVEAAAAASYQLQPEQAAHFAAPPASFASLPRLNGPPEGRELATWQTRVPLESERGMTGSAIGAIYYVLDGAECEDGPDVKSAADELRLALARPTSHYAYTYLPQDRRPLLLSLYVIDPVASVLWVIQSNL